MKWLKSFIYSAQIEIRMVVSFANWYGMVRTITLNWWKDRNQNLIVLSSMDKARAPKEIPSFKNVYGVNMQKWMNQKGWRRRESCLSFLEQVCIFPAYLSWYTQWCYTSLSQLLHKYNTGFLCRLFLCFTTLFMTLTVTCTCVYCSLTFLENKT